MHWKFCIVISRLLTSLALNVHLWFLGEVLHCLACGKEPWSGSPFRGSERSNLERQEQVALPLLDFILKKYYVDFVQQYNRTFYRYVRQALKWRNQDLFSILLDTELSMDCGLRRRLPLVVQWGKLSVLKDLLDASAPLTPKIADEALSQSVKRKDEEMIELLVSQGARSTYNKLKPSALEIAVRSDDEPTMRYLLSKGADPDDYGCMLLQQVVLICRASSWMQSLEGQLYRRIWRGKESSL